MNLMRLAREMKSMSQEEVARLTGISRYRICRAERGWINLKPDELKKIGRVLRTRLDVS
jgi:transcriptional regulator with XRE-family HTH domain